MRRTLFGGKAGLLATLPMTAAIYMLRRFSSRERARDIAPQEITDGVLGQLALDDKLPQPARRGVGMLSHLGFGAAAGLPYVLLRRRAMRPSAMKGLLYGLAVWAGSYGGWLPKIGLQPSLAAQGRGRRRTMMLSHVVWGVALDRLNAAFRKRRHSRQISSSLAEKAYASINRAS